MEFWDIVKSLKMQIDAFIEATKRDSQAGMDCLTGLNGDEVSVFHILLQKLKLSLDMRFPCPSTSFDMKCRQYSNVLTTPNPSRQQLHPPKCTIMPLIQFFTFPQTLMNENSQPSMVPLALQDEVGRLTFDIMHNETQIRMVNDERCAFLSKEVGMKVESPINLQDVFRVIEKTRYPLLWKEIVKIKTSFLQLSAVNDVSASSSIHSMST